jgi:hypothetical protein
MTEQRGWPGKRDVTPSHRRTVCYRTYSTLHALMRARQGQILAANKFLALSETRCKISNFP